MPEGLFRGLFDTDLTTVISVSDFLLCLFVSLVLGLIMSLSYMYRTRYTKSFVVALAILPTVVCVVIMMVNGNVGAGVAAAGAFSLVRFRSVPGTAKEICALFLAMGAGMITGMGYLGFAFLTGGTFIGTGASGMTQTFSNSTCGVVTVDVGNQSAETKIGLYDADGNTILTYTPEEDFQMLILSSPQLALQ